MKDRLFGFDSVSPHDDTMAHLTTVYDNVSQSLLESILRGEKIPYAIKERGSGSSVKIITGYSMFGTDFFVRKEDFEKANEILQAMQDPNAEYVDEQDGKLNPEDDAK